ncbi:hypothetical protein EX30DRAFT_395464 [Ascodesmis nigricans]|uniref:Actin-like ATPase domain-containing protein n=1 Tax=Ascodesmis nigricans TaxID=341454 RepID=A0A4S2MYI6_9PEZI|nr:hypothetical protein EX30DRAFT_395464 [Ascodesmis nigricans]
MSTIIVGIDLGMTFTGVAYALYRRGYPPPGSYESLIDVPLPDNIKYWPGREDEVKYKAVTAVSIPSESSQRSKSPTWGFLCETKQGIGSVRHRNFKLLLDEGFHADVVSDAERRGLKPPPSYNAVKNAYRIYLRGLYSHILQYLSAEFEKDEDRYGVKLKINFAQHRVIYSFSVATTWGPTSSTISTFKQLIDEAGFGSITNHSYRIGLTEAEAAAVTTMMDPSFRVVDEGPDSAYQFQKNDVLITVDLGGGTSDATMLRLTDGIFGGDKYPRYKMEQLCTVDGIPYGSTNIDRKIQSLVKNRLASIPKDATSWKPRSDIEDLIILLKEDFGEPNIMLLPTLILDAIQPVALEGTRDVDPYACLTFDNAGIRRGQMEISKEDIALIFDKIIHKIIDLLENQWKSKPVRTKNCYLSLTGGLSSSKYVRKKLVEHFSERQIRVLCPEEPALAVCRGLVIDMIHQLRGQGSLITRRSRCSYGIIYRERFNKMKHEGQPVKYDEVVKRAFAVNRIRWLVEENQLIPDNTDIEHHVSRYIPARSNEVDWKEWIVAHSGKGDRPDYYLERTGVSYVGNLDVNFKLEMKHVNNEKAVKKKILLDFRNLGKRVWKISYVVGLKVGPADLSMELWYDGEVKNTNDLQMDWREVDEEDLRDLELADGHHHHTVADLP